MGRFKEAKEVYDLAEDILSPGSRGIILEIFTSPLGFKSAAVKWIKHRDSSSMMPSLLGNGVWIEDCFNLKLISSGKRNESRNN
jgi:hypothetical protein